MIWEGSPTISHVNVDKDGVANLWAKTNDVIAERFIWPIYQSSHKIDKSIIQETKTNSDREETILEILWRSYNFNRNVILRWEYINCQKIQKGNP